MVININFKKQKEGFEKFYEVITPKFKEDNPKIFLKNLITIYRHFIKDGYKVSKIGRMSKKGTRIAFKQFKDEEDIKVYVDKINELIEEYNAKYSSTRGNSFKNIEYEIA